MKKAIFSIALFAALIISAQAQSSFALNTGAPVTSTAFNEDLSEKASPRATAPAGATHLPQFPGGNEALATFIAQRAHYPMSARENGFQGKVRVKITIDATGRPGHFQVIDPVSTELEAAALQAVQHMPDWQPARQNGTPVRCKVVVPVTFQLN